jgi:hypothetical protein
MVRTGQVDREPSDAYYYLDMREENICKGPGLAGRHGQQLLEGKDGAGGTGGHRAQCRVLLPGYERGEYLRGARPDWEAQPAAVEEQGWCGRDRWTRSPVPFTITWIQERRISARGQAWLGGTASSCWRANMVQGGTGGQGAQCRVLLPGYERGEYLRGARPGWEARPAAVGGQVWCGAGQVDREMEPNAAYYYLDMREENICEGPGLAGRHGQQLLEGKYGAGGTGGHGAQCRGQNSAAGRGAPQRGAAAHSA